MVWLEALRIEDSPTPSPELTLHGTLLARNAAFEKHVFVRFTLDGWCTTSEVGARYVGGAASPFRLASYGDRIEQEGQGEKHEAEDEEPGPGWDRFAFSIRLTDYAHSATSPEDRTPSGLGRGLEGRTLVLVARFFAPWVRAGGVAPYAWCAPPPSHSSAPNTASSPNSHDANSHEGQDGQGTQERWTPATDVSPSGRPWIGTGGGGGGGGGEWWDNNGGRNYEVGFRCVPTAQGGTAAAAAAHEGKEGKQHEGKEGKQHEGKEGKLQTNVIPFPSTSSEEATTPTRTATTPTRTATTATTPTPTATTPTTPTLSTPTPTLSISTTTAQAAPASPPTIPPPPPPRTAHAQALAAKLGRLRLRNYAAPATGGGRAVWFPGVGTPPLPAASAGAVEKKETGGVGEKEKIAEDGPEAGEQKETDAKEKTEQVKQEETATSGAVGLYWPWGRAPAAPAPSSAPTSAPPHQAHHQAEVALETETETDDRPPSLSFSFSSHSSSSSETEDDENENEGELTPPTSPLGARGLLVVIESEEEVVGGEGVRISKVGGGIGGEVEAKATEAKELENGGEKTESVEPQDVPLPASPPSGAGARAHVWGASNKTKNANKMDMTHTHSQHNPKGVRRDDGDGDQPARPRPRVALEPISTSA
ncbi:hypothetical protein B0H12DRAFT_77955 [Mycena haematopus]|nr:hypothetical protein B0H12DRAFT_77955 [Mycena haematopus]